MHAISEMKKIVLTLIFSSCVVFAEVASDIGRGRAVELADIIFVCDVETVEIKENTLRISAKNIRPLKGSPPKSPFILKDFKGVQGPEKFVEVAKNPPGYNLFFLTTSSSGELRFLNTPPDTQMAQIPEEVSIEKCDSYNELLVEILKKSEKIPKDELLKYFDGLDSVSLDSATLEEIEKHLPEAKMVLGKKEYGEQLASDFATPDRNRMNSEFLELSKKLESITNGDREQWVNLLSRFKRDFPDAQKEMAYQKLRSYTGNDFEFSGFVFNGNKLIVNFSASKSGKTSTVKIEGLFQEGEFLITDIYFPLE